jgi:hypothetical protein
LFVYILGYYDIHCFIIGYRCPLKSSDVAPPPLPCEYRESCPLCHEVQYDLPSKSTTVLFCLITHRAISNTLHCKKELAVFPSPAGMSLIKLFLGGNNLVFSRPERVWSVTSRLGTGKWLTLFYSVCTLRNAKQILAYSCSKAKQYANYLPHNGEQFSPCTIAGECTAIPSYLLRNAEKHAKYLPQNAEQLSP